MREVVSSGIQWYTDRMQRVVTIPKTVTGREELVVLPRSLLERLISRQVTATDVLKRSREAKKLKRGGRLPVLRSLRALRQGV